MASTIKAYGLDRADYMHWYVCNALVISGYNISSVQNMKQKNPKIKQNISGAHWAKKDNYKR